MRLYPLGAAQAAIDHPEYGHIKAGKGGGFDLSDDLSDELASFCIRGKRIWETEDERSERLQREGLAARRDPAALFDTVSGMADLTRQLAEVQLAHGRPAAEAPADPAGEIAALRKRLAELEGEQPDPGPPGTGGSEKTDTTGSAAPGAEDDSKPEPGAKAPAKPRSAPAKNTPAD